MRHFFWLIMLLLVLATGCAGGNEAVSVQSTTDMPSVSEQPSSEVDVPQESSAQPVTSSAASEPESSESSTETVAESALAQVTQATFGDEELFLSAAPAKQSWPAAYETFYDAYPEVSHYYTFSQMEDVSLRDQFVFTRWTIAPSDIAGNIYDNIAEGAKPAGILRKFFIKEQGGFGVGNPIVGVLLNFAGTDNFFGEGVVWLSEATAGNAKGEALLSEIVGFKEGHYRYRTSMTITEGIEAQLLSQGFSPESTRAYALTIENYAYGVCFIDKELISFYCSGDLYHISQDMRIGVVYPLELVVEDIHDRICEIDPQIDEINSAIPGSEDVTPPTETSSGVANPLTAKPVIYLYPQQAVEVEVKLGYPEEHFTYTYPRYQDGWRVLAYPDGKLKNLSDNTEHHYLFWEGDKKLNWDLSEGFVVQGDETEDFLREKLAFMGLTAREYNDFITYWVPEMQGNPYNLISFSTTQYEQLAPLEVLPRPDSVLRVHMVYKRLEQPVEVKPQVLSQWQRAGFAVVEWGGSRA